MNARELARLQGLAALLRDARLATLHKAAADRAESQARIEALDRPESGTLGPLEDARVALRYRVWAEARRAEINLVLSRQTVAWMAARDAAALATARADVLGRLAAKVGDEARRLRASREL